nr:ATP synthase F0 subunit 8 [Meteorus sp. 1 XHS-2023a]
MPQMSPMDWFMLMFFFFFIFMLIMIMIYFIYLDSLKKLILFNLIKDYKFKWY